MDSRLSYLYAADHRICDNDTSSLVNPVLNLTDTFNKLVECNLKVYLRVRPVLAGEAQENQQEGNDQADQDDDKQNETSSKQVHIQDQHTVHLNAPASSNTFKNSQYAACKAVHKYSFTQVFGPKVEQDEFYNRTTLNMVDMFVSGQNCLLFTYGATNSGKTYTVQGTQNNKGLLPRLMEDLFSAIGSKLYSLNDLKPKAYCSLEYLEKSQIEIEEKKKEKLLGNALHDTSRSSQSSSRASSPTITSTDTRQDETECSEFVYAIFISFAEIYNEKAYDLLEQLPPRMKSRATHLLGEDREGCSYIKDLHYVRVDSAPEALRVLKIGRQNLHFAATKLNHNSSRSHCIITIKLVIMASSASPMYARVAMFTVCDLAGAERASKTQGTGDRLREAANINTSLLVLSRCIAALRQNQLSQRGGLESSTLNSTATSYRGREVPVPYRDSKLTRLLHSFFLGRDVSAMIVNISQTPMLFDETLNVLKFSAIAKQVVVSQDPLPPPPPIQVGGRKSTTTTTTNRLTRFIRSSMGKKAARPSSAAVAAGDSTGRLSVPWADRTSSSVNITFGEQSIMSGMTEVPEEDEDEEDYEGVQELVDHMKDLSAALQKVNQEKKNMEVRLRNELCTNFAKQLVRVEGDWRERMEAAETRSTDLHNWRIAKLTEYYTESQAGKRCRNSSPGLDTLDQSLHDFRKQSRLQELEEELVSWKQQSSDHEATVAALTASLKKAMDSGNKKQEENTKLTFQLATLTQNYDKQQIKLEASEQRNMAPDDTAALKALQGELAESLAEVEKTKEELQLHQEMLVEASESYCLERAQKEQVVAQLVNQDVELDDLREELSKSEQLTSDQGAALNTLEGTMENVKQNLRDATKESAALKITDAALLREKNGLVVEAAELKNTCEELEDIVRHCKEETVEQKFLFTQMNEVLKERDLEIIDLEQELKQHKMRRKRSVGGEIESSNMSGDVDLSLRIAKQQIGDLHYTIDQKNEQLQKLENIKNENKRLSNRILDQDKLVSSNLHVEHERTVHKLNAMITSDGEIIKVLKEEVTTLCEKRDDVVCEKEKLAAILETVNEEKTVLLNGKEGLMNENEELVKIKNGLTEQITELTKISAGHQNEVDEMKKVHISTLRYRDCELSAVKKEADDARQFLVKLREDKTELQTKVRTSDVETVTLLAKIAELETQAAALNDKLAELSSASHADEEANKLVEKLKEDLKQAKASYQMVQKEMVAVREARCIEVLDLSSLRSQISVLQQEDKYKEEEIKSLQAEVKKALARSVMDTPATSIPVLPNFCTPMTDVQRQDANQMLGSAVKLETRLEAQQKDTDAIDTVSCSTRSHGRRTGLGAILYPDESEPEQSITASRGRRKTTTTKKSSAAKGKKAAGVAYTPDDAYLENQENRASRANCSVLTQSGTYSRSSKRRPLYQETEELLDCSPHLVAPLPPVDSPHTIVRRNLRAKGRAK